MSEQEKAVVSGSVANPATKVDNAITLQEALVILWKKKWTLALFVVAAAIIGGAYAMWVRPQYSSDVLLQVNVKGASSKSTKAMGEMGEVLELASPADAEIELMIDGTRKEVHYASETNGIVPAGCWYVGGTVDSGAEISIRASYGDIPEIKASTVVPEKFPPCNISLSDGFVSVTIPTLPQP